MLVVPKGLQRQVMSVNHESVFGGHLRARRQKFEYSRTSFGQDYVWTSLGFAVPAMWASQEEKSRMAVSKRYH